MNEQEIRTFIALKIVPQKHFINLFNQIKFELKEEKVRWVTHENMHITLLFLGQIKTENIPVVSQLILQATKQLTSFSLNIKGLGYFSNKNYPQVLFCGIQENNQLYNLTEAINRIGIELGIKKTFKRFTPHITLGRLKEVQNTKHFQEIVSQFEKTWFQKDFISEVIFYKSSLTNTGAIYQPIKTYKLQ